MNETNAIRIPASRLEEAQKALAKIVKKAQKYGAVITVEVGPVVLVEETVVDWDGKKRVIHREMIDLLVTGDAPRVGNHEFLAHVELGSAGNIVDVRPGVADLDHRFRESDGYCEHCETSRVRKDVYVVRDLTTGQQLQIGRNCLRDYMGLDDPKTIAARFAFYRSMDALRDEYTGSGSIGFSQSLEGLVSLSAVCVRLFGWCSQGQASNDETLTPTSYYVLLALSGGKVGPAEAKLRARIQDERSEADYETARAVIAWVRQEMKPNSDYEHNLRVLFAGDEITNGRRVGIVVSAIAAYHRSVAKNLRITKERETAKASQFVGEIGKRIRGIKVTLQMQRVIGSSDWGDKLLVKFVDESGNLYSWFTGRGTGLEIGEQCLLTATVKDHKEYNGAFETNLTRCSIESL
jgi:hypothetical protein